MAPVGAATAVEGSLKLQEDEVEQLLTQREGDAVEVGAPRILARCMEGRRSGREYDGWKRACSPD